MHHAHNIVCVCRKARVLLGVSGSVAAIKVAQLVHELTLSHDVKIVATTAARHFISEQELPPSVLPLHGMAVAVLSMERVDMRPVTHAHLMQQ